MKLREPQASLEGNHDADVPPHETSPVAKSEEKRLFSQATETPKLAINAPGPYVDTIRIL